MSHPYDEASDIINQAFPELGAANAIIRDLFPAAAAADRILADSGLIPRRGRGFEGGGPEGLRAGTAGGIRGPLPPGTRRGPHYTGPRRSLSLVSQVIRTDKAGTVDINVWSAKMKKRGISGETIVEAYNLAGGSADLSAEQRAGNTSDFLGDFVDALEDLGADPDVILVAYHEAGGLRGQGQGNRGGGGGGGFLGGAARAGQNVVDTAAKAAADVGAEIGRAFNKVF